MTKKPSDSSPPDTVESLDEGQLALSQQEISNAIETAEALDLSAIKTNWYFGEWHKLTELNLQAVAQSNDRAVLALLIASAHIQQGDDDRARELTRLSLKWGCSPRSAAKVLTAGVHNTLARAAALRGREDKAIQHFRASVEVVDKKNVDLIAHARSVREMTKIGLMDQASMLIDRQIEQSAQSREFKSRRAELSAIQSNQQVILDALGESSRISTHNHDESVSKKTVNVPEAYAAGERLVILVAGMRHSGSTALFNAIRLAMESQGIPFESGYTEKFDLERIHQADKGIFLLKTHEYRDDVASVAGFVFTTKRDLRDTVASAVRRKFPLCEKLNPIEYSKYNRQIWDVWASRSDLEFNYENYMQAPVQILSTVLTSVGLESVNPKAIQEGIVGLPTDKYETTLLSPIHITDPDHKLTYRDTLKLEQITLINRNNLQWLKVHGYE